MESKGYPSNAGEQDSAIVIFDGVCNFCNGFINFVIDQDQNQYFKFAANQSEAGKKLLQQFNVPLSLDTIVVIENGNYYIYSTAVLRIFRQLGGLWSMLYGFNIVPRWIRDSCYRWFAKHRYQWMGRTEACRMPTEELQQRFLD